jgi:hypothetical protein
VVGVFGSFFLAKTFRKFKNFLKVAWLVGLAIPF